MAFNSNKTTAWDRTTLNDGILFNDEFNNLYDNLVDVNGRVVNLSDALSTLTQYAYSSIAGLIQGEIYWDKTGGGAGQVVLRSGRYEVLGKILTFTADVSVNPLTQNYGTDALEDDAWYYTLMDSAGNLRCQLATGSALHTGLEVNSVSVPSSGILQVTFRNNPDLSNVSAGMVFRSDDLGGGGAGLVTVTEVDAGNFQIKVANNRGTMLPAETEPVGTGSIFNSVPKVNSPNPQFDVTRQGYYDGDWRILGIDHYDSTREKRWVRAYGSGYERNDNELILSVQAAYDPAWPMLPRFVNIVRQWGHDYSFDSDKGTQIFIERTSRVQAQYISHSHDPSMTVIGFSLDASDTELQAIVHRVGNFEVSRGYAGAYARLPLTANYSGTIEAGSIFRPHGIGLTSVNGNYDYMHIELHSV